MKAIIFCVAFAAAIARALPITWENATADEAKAAAGALAQGRAGIQFRTISAVNAFFAANCIPRPGGCANSMGISAGCATGKMRMTPPPPEHVDPSAVDALIEKWNAQTGVEDAHDMPWYDQTLTPLADAYAKPIGWAALLRTLPRLRGVLAPGAGGDAQGMLMHWLGAWAVRGLGLSAKEALQTYASRANETALVQGRGLVHGIVWADLTAFSARERAGNRVLWARALDICRPEGFRCKFLYVSCLHGVGHAFQRLARDPARIGYRRRASLFEDIASAAAAVGAAVGRAEKAAGFPGVVACGGAPDADAALMCATGFYHDEATMVETVSLHALRDELRASAGLHGTLHKQKAWTHGLCVGAPYEAACFLRLFEGVFAPLPSVEKPDCRALGLEAGPLRACLLAKSLFDASGAEFHAAAIRAASSGDASAARCGTSGGTRGCFVHAIAFHCEGLARRNLRLACVAGAAVGASRALRFAHVPRAAAEAYCSALSGQRYVDACVRGLLSWTGTIDDGEPFWLGADLLGRRRGKL
mmetsp:Transcript_24397/g.73211  ORF Transcript_24397/g.73211 Transcript_24397/m.73211 type:complete len:532 (-) Transcript_24397:27-1622(-)